jgi:ABC-2 type transport system ATP-binding protein
MTRTARPESGGANERSPLPSALSLAHVHKSYSDVVALRDVTFATSPGEVVVLLGPNGAGKTTAASLLSGLISPAEGTVRVFGHDPREAKGRRRLGTAPQTNPYPASLSVRELIDFVRAHYPAPSPTEPLLKDFGLDGVADRLARTLSGGLGRRLTLCLAFAGAPDAVVLDEPTAGLDVDFRRRLGALVKGFAARGGVVLMTTHQLPEAEEIASRILVLKAGTIVAEGTPDAVRRAAMLPSRVRIRCTQLPSLPRDVVVERANGTYLLRTKEPGALVEMLVRRGVRLQDLEVSPGSLEEAFLALTGAS